MRSKQALTNVQAILEEEREDWHRTGGQSRTRSMENSRHGVWKKMEHTSMERKWRNMGWQNLSWKSRNIFQSGLESKKMRYTKEAWTCLAMDLEIIRRTLSWRCGSRNCGRIDFTKYGKRNPRIKKQIYHREKNFLWIYLFFVGLCWDCYTDFI